MQLQMIYTLNSNKKGENSYNRSNREKEKGKEKDNKKD